MMVSDGEMHMYTLESIKDHLPFMCPLYYVIKSQGPLGV